MLRLAAYPIYLLLILFSVTLTGCEPHLASEYLEEIKEHDDIINPSSQYIAVLGDIQSYTCYHTYHLTVSAYWLKNAQLKFHNIQGLLQVGDVSENNIPLEWKRYRNCISFLDGLMPVITVTGNHDYDWGYYKVINSRESTHLTKYVSNSLLVDNIVERFHPSKLDNIIVRLNIHDTRINVIALEFAPRKEVVAWADSIVRTHPEERYILMTHEFLYKGKRIVKGSYSEIQFPGGKICTPEEIWQQLVYPNDNIICVLCGHNGYSEQFYSSNSAGRMVPQILFNLQYQENGGDSEIQMWEFPEHSDFVNVFVYNPGKFRVSERDSTRFSFQYRY